MATEQVVETVAESLEEAAVVTRRINTTNVGLVAGGIGIGIAIGFFIGWRFNRAKIYAEAFRQSEEEVEKIREMYQNAAKVIRDKPDLEDVIEDRGYTLPSAVVAESESPITIRPPVPIISPLVVDKHIPETPTGKSESRDWDYEEELANRTPDRPYIIHQNEFTEEMPEYKTEVLTWYAGDEVLTNEQDEKIGNPDDIVGLENMDKFGHGTDDSDVVFIRNESLNMQYEVCRLRVNYAEEVLGLSDESRE